MDNQAFQLLKDKLEELCTDVKELRADVGHVKQDLGHYKGFLGGITFVFTIAWTGITYFLSHFNSKN